MSKPPSQETRTIETPSTTSRIVDAQDHNALGAEATNDEPHRVEFLNGNPGATRTLDRTLDSMDSMAEAAKVLGPIVEALRALEPIAETLKALGPMVEVLKEKEPFPSNPRATETPNQIVKAAERKQETKYVLSGQPTGWAVMAKEVREFDDEKVKSCKEDVDTLLVFAGLFSAVLSAFLVGAYPSLQPDNMRTTNYNLERIVNQTASYNFNTTTGRLAATATPSLPLPPFQPTDRDIRVNVLWFASLIISLITASFGMLVKQWLREFLAVEVPSPQARLRIRHFREPEIRGWRVYEIAATLPLFLQLSLGLFLVGLCYFTAAVHESVGHTTLPLVVGWAFCLFTATVLPIFFPRCPYKTTLLKVPIGRLHRALSRTATRTVAALHAYDFGPMIAGVSIADRWQWRQWWGNVCQQYTVWCQLLLTRWRPLCQQLFTNWLLWFGERYQECKVSCSWWYLAMAARHVASKFCNIPDEREAVKDTVHDIGILLSVDAIQANDDLLGTTIAEALQHTYPEPADVISFMINILEHRLPVVEGSGRIMRDWPFHDSFHLPSLRPQAKDGIAKILENHVGNLRGWYISSIWVPFNDLNPDSCNILRAFALVMSLPLDTINHLASTSSIIVFLRHHCERFPALCRDMLLITSSGLKDEAEHGDNVARVLQIMDRLATGSMKLEFSKEARCFEEIHALEMRQAMGQRVGLSVDPNGFDWKTWTYPAGTPDDLAGAYSNYLTALASRGLKLIHASGGVPDLATFAKLLPILQTALRISNRHQLHKSVNSFHKIVVLSLLHALTAKLLVASLLANGSGLVVQWYRRSSSQDEGSTRSLIHDIRSHKPMCQKSVDILVSAMRRRLSQDVSALPQVINLCTVTSFILLIGGFRGAATDYSHLRELYSSFAASIRSSLALSTQKPDAAGTVLTVQEQKERKAQNASADLAFTCLLAIDFEGRFLARHHDFYVEWNSWKNYDKWHSKFSEQESIHPDNLVEVLGQLIGSREPPHKLYRLHRLRELKAIAAPGEVFRRIPSR